ncbi:MAG: hypothetical protein WCF20_13215 [Methylovirgula sp.]
MSQQETTEELSEKAKEIERMGDTIVRAAEGRRPMPISLSDSLKSIAELTALCEEALGEHLDGKLGKDALSSVVIALNAVHAGIDSLTVFQALEGAAYNTITVAND